MIVTTLNKIREHHPCQEGWTKLLKHLGKTTPDDEPLPLLTILDSNGLDDTLWCMRAVSEHSATWRKYAVWCARQVEHLMTDQRSKDALDVAWKHAGGEVSDEELTAAYAAAGAAARAAAYAAAGAAADAAGAAAYAAAGAAAYAAADAAAGAAAYAAADAAEAARAANAAQEAKFREILRGDYE